MGAVFQFDRMLPTVQAESANIQNAKRQVEVFTHGGKLFLRVGHVGSENSGENRHTVQLSTNDANDLISGIESGMTYLSMK